ncbi:MAG: ribbon-helix-helix domain-containing protein [Podoviridae sp. cty5g4]|nr:MAG: ribbon-helix-helix domain-containing protein [Podoviridae sp. cty5g4]
MCIINLHIDFFILRQRDIIMKRPENRMERINLTLPTYHKNLLKQEADRLGISMSECLRKLITRYLK